MDADQKKFKILGIDHLGMAPKAKDQSVSFFCDLLGLGALHQEVVVDQGVKVDVIASTSSGNTSGPKLELLEPMHANSPIQAFLDKRGGGIHHLALRVDNIEACLSFLVKRGVRLIDKEPRTGEGGSKIAFVHPQTCGGILVELVER